MKVFVVPNEQKAGIDVLLEQLDELAKKYKLELCVCRDSGTQFPQLTPERTELLCQCDVILAIGGDGTIMHCARLSALYGKPVLGVNAGKLGFLAQVEQKNLARAVKRLTRGDYNVEYRTAIAARFLPEQYPPIDFAINDIVITKSADYNIAGFETRCGDRMIDCYRADGLIFSTPTGSTAYNLSAGGPVIDPLLDAITLVTICPHSLSSRPMVFSQQRVITVQAQETPLIIIADGSTRRTVAAGTVVEISTAERRAGFITFHEQEFFEILTTKIKQRR